MIKCPHCNKHVRVLEDWSKGINTLENHGKCKGSEIRVRGNWRDDPSYRPLAKADYLR